MESDTIRALHFSNDRFNPRGLSLDNPLASIFPLKKNNNRKTSEAVE